MARRLPRQKLGYSAGIREKDDGMPGTEDDPLEFSDLAEEARAIAERMPASGAKETLLNITRAYEAMLNRAEKKQGQ